MKVTTNNWNKKDRQKTPWQSLTKRHTKPWRVIVRVRVWPILWPGLARPGDGAIVKAPGTQSFASHNSCLGSWECCVQFHSRDLGPLPVDCDDSQVDRHRGLIVCAYVTRWHNTQTKQEHRHSVCGPGVAWLFLHYQHASQNNGPSSWPLVRVSLSLDRIAYRDHHDAIQT